MTKPKTIDRRRFLTSAASAGAALAAVGLSGCKSEDDGGSAGTAAAGTAAGTNAGMGGGAAGTVPAGGTAAAGTSGGMGGTMVSGGTGGTMASGGTGGTMASGGTGGTMASGGTGGTMASGGTGGTGGTMASGGTGGAMASGGTDGGTLMCDVDVMGPHSHPVTVPGSDVEQGFQDAPYELENGGTGHTHTLMLSAYDFAYLQAGATATVPSSEDAGHSHQCAITCTAS